MKHSSCLRDFTKYVSLNVFGMLGISGYILADTFFVAKGLGTNGLTALNLALPVYSFINGSGLMLGMGGATKYAIARSKYEEDTANHIFTHTILLSLGFAFFFFLLGLFFSGDIIRLLGADDTVYDMSKTYLQVILLFAPMFLLNNILLCFVRNDGAPQLATLAMLGGSFSNIILDYIFMFPLGMGIFGAVLATGLAPIISMLILSPYFIQKNSGFRLVKCKIVAQLRNGIFSSGVPSLITEVSSGVVIIIFNTIILKLQGNVGVAAYGIIANLSFVVISIYTGIAQGLQPLISHNHGVGNQANVKSLLRYGLITLCATSALVYTVVFFGASQITAIFNSEHNQVLQDIAIVGLRIYFTGCLFAGFNIILSVYFTSTEYTRPAHIISVLRGFVIIVPMALFLSTIGGMLGVWWVFPATELIVATLALLLYRRSKRKRTTQDLISFEAIKDA